MSRFKTICLFTIICITTLLTSCSRGPVYEAFQKPENSSWNRFKAFWFSTDQVKPGKSYDIFIVVRYTEAFPEDNLYTGLTVHSPSGDWRTQEHRIGLRDRGGKWLGEKKDGYYEIVFPARKRYEFPVSGTYRFEFENLMSKYETPGITELGLRILKSKAKDR